MSFLDDVKRRVSFGQRWDNWRADRSNYCCQNCGGDIGHHHDSHRCNCGHHDRDDLCSCGSNKPKRDCCGGTIKVQPQSCIPMHKVPEFPFRLDRESLDLIIQACNQKEYSLFEILANFGFAIILNGQGPPSSQLTTDGLYYIDTAEGSMWRRGNQQWTKVLGPTIVKET